MALGDTIGHSEIVKGRCAAGVVRVLRARADRVSCAIVSTGAPIFRTPSEKAEKWVAAGGRPQVVTLAEPRRLPFPPPDPDDTREKQGRRRSRCAAGHSVPLYC
jgi:hypothetical protein